MALIVQKYGGTSVANPERIKKVAERVAKFVKQGHQIVVVVSAMSGETDRLIKLAKEIQSTPDPRELDVMVSTGEQVTIGMTAMALMSIGIKAKSYTGTQVRILTDNAHTKARILDIDDTKIRADLNAGYVVVVAGFQGVTEDGSITTLGRGGSDTTGVALAAALKADECQIYTDVDGVYTTDPRIVPEARRLETITFEEMLEMASLGSKVLQIRSVEFAGKYKVKLRVLSSFEDKNDGTLITFEENNTMEQPIISGIAFNRDEAKLSLLGVPDKPGIAHSILSPVGAANVDVDMIIQNIGVDGSTDFSFTVHRNEYQKTLDLLNNSIKPQTGAREVRGDNKICKVSLVGVGMRSHAGVASLMFKTLSEEGINIQMISTSEIKISVVIDEKYMELAVRALHKAFNLDNSASA
ncbi:aspartate kinase [Ferrovum sp. PN-J185]|uniref:aspartate kinase n=1 Tax=Ferrovum sp. PN-J185 TaxID=1356306 RepID=UPI0007963603|nr:aspartate kinase [Ferrovum sp. PN-J185]KXW56240.1 aspartate kinase [Ferrovum sp. PN-J185]